MELNDTSLLSYNGLLEYLRGFVTERRRDLIETVLAQRTRHITIVLENIYHPPNASAVIRTCECFGIQDLHVIADQKKFKANSDVVQGAAKWVDIHRHTEPEQNNSEVCLRKLKEQGYKIAATTLRQEKYTSLEKIPVNEKVAVCFGCEETGLSDTAHQEADYFVHIPMYGFTESYNISVSAALILQKLMTSIRSDNSGYWKLTEEEKQVLRMRWTRKSLKHAEHLIQRFMSDNGIQR
ncbi:MAG: RNA methyltransferase [Lentisphaerae bacterium]|nr:RNA methyltransferase [Lentisphaerota bacterium]MCP4103677.1 RNA methyltransferase [Lentisphaerota bacterium]